MAIQVIIDKYEINKYQNEILRTSSASYDKLPTGFYTHCSFNNSKIKPCRFNHMGHMKINRTHYDSNGNIISKERCNVALMDKYQFY